MERPICSWSCACLLYSVNNTKKSACSMPVQHTLRYVKTGLWDRQPANSYRAHGHQYAPGLRPAGSPESSQTEHHDTDSSVYALNQGRSWLRWASELQCVNPDSGHCYRSDDTTAEAVLGCEGVCALRFRGQNLRGAHGGLDELRNTAAPARQVGRNRAL